MAAGVETLSPASTGSRLRSPSGAANLKSKISQLERSLAMQDEIIESQQRRISALEAEKVILQCMRLRVACAAWLNGARCCARAVHRSAPTRTWSRTSWRCRSALQRKLRHCVRILSIACRFRWQRTGGCSHRCAPVRGWARVPRAAAHSSQPSRRRCPQISVQKSEFSALTRKLQETEQRVVALEAEIGEG